MSLDLGKAFHAAMINLYVTAKSEAKYNATRFLSMVNEMGGLETARTLLRADTVSEGYTALWERERLDLTVEAVVLDERWRSLFSDEERAVALKRLLDYGYQAALRDSND